MSPSPGHATKLLFVCSRNEWRSRTAEDLYRDLPGYEARSAGTAPGARVRVTSGHVGWADVIFVMEAKHRDYLRSHFPETLAGKRLICLRIPDEFTYNDPDLIDLLKAQLGPHVVVPV